MSPEVALAFRSIDMVGVFVNGVLGGMIARHKHFDVVGFAVLAIISGLGGGIIRDCMLQTGPVLAVSDQAYPFAALCGAAVAFFLRVQGRVWMFFLPIADAVVLGAWATTGTLKSLNAGVAWLPALMLGVCTAVGGGMIRDVAVGRIPAVFGGNTLYAIPAVISGAAVLIGHTAGLPLTWVLIGSTLVGSVIAVAARILGLSLPVHGDGTWSSFRRWLYRVSHRRPQQSAERGPASS